MALRRPRARPHVLIENEPDIVTHPHNVSMYKTPPKNLEEFQLLEKMSIDRAQLLKIVESASDCIILSEVWKNKIYEQLVERGMNDYLKLIKGCQPLDRSDFQIRYHDVVSHHMLRLAYCQSEELRYWFIRQECDLFQLRLSNMSEQSLCKFIADEAKECQLLSLDEIEEYREDIESSTHGMFTFGVTKMYKVHWHDVQPLIENQLVFVIDGFAYVPTYQMYTYLANDMRKRLIDYLRMASKKYKASVDKLLAKMLTYINTTFSPAKIDEDFESEHLLTASNIDKYAKENFPLCMRLIHDHLCTKHHLKHFARVQYLFFLKGTGMLFEDAMEFWRNQFTQKVSEKEFEKRYAYSVKHSYGKVGRMVSCSPHCCNKIIEQFGNASDVHGCPYKCMDATGLVTILQNCGLEPTSIEDIMKIKQNDGYRAACSKYFQIMHKQPMQDTVEHPNKYFIDSCQLKFDVLGDDDDSEGDTGFGNEEVLKDNEIDINCNTDTSDAVMRSPPKTVIMCREDEIAATCSRR